MTEPNENKGKQILNKLQLDDLLQLEKELREAGEESLSEDEREKYKVIRSILDRIEKGGQVQEVVRDAVFEAVRDSFQDALVFGEAGSKDPYERDGADLIEEKRTELYEMLDHLDQHLVGKDVKEVTALFSSMLDIQGQLCMQKTEGVITVRTRLFNFFTLPDNKAAIRPELKQEISLIFTPEEVQAIRMRMPDIRKDDPMRPFYTTVLDQAYDVVQYNEMSGHLLLEMTNYFLHKLVYNGYGDHSKVVEFQERHDRCKMSLKKALDDLRAVEIVINNHLSDRQVLLEVPKCLRALIQIKLGLVDKKHTQPVLQQLYSLLGDYSRARSAVAFDFNRLPSYQHGVRLRQSVILNLQKDVLKLTYELFEKEFASIKEEMDRMLAEIEAQSETLDPNTPEYEQLMKQKEKIQQRLEESRRKLDVVRSQQSLVDVQHNMVGEAIQRYQSSEAMYQKLDEDLKSRPKEKIDTRPTKQTQKKIPSRMVMARNARESGKS